MEKDILSQVIDAEKEIQQCLEAERVKAREWLERANKEAEEAMLLEQRKIKEMQEQSLAEADKQAAQKAEEIIREATAASEHLGQLKPEVLRSIVEQRIPGILPG